MSVRNAGVSCRIRTSSVPPMGLDEAQRLATRTRGSPASALIASHPARGVGRDSAQQKREPRQTAPAQESVGAREDDREVGLCASRRLPAAGKACLDSGLSSNIRPAIKHSGCSC